MLRVSDEGLTITISGSEDIARLTLDGELDLATEPVFDVAIRATERTDPPVLALDLGLLRFIDSTGIELLVRLKKKTAERKQDLRVDNVFAPEVVKVFALTGVGRILSTSPER